MSVSAFLLSAAQERARQVLAERELPAFTARDWNAFAAVGATMRGFYSLAMSGIHRDNLPPEHATRYPNFSLPVARLARLAVDQRHQRQGLGGLLLADALQRCLRLSLEIGLVGVIVVAKDERARGWYGRYEFERLPDSPLTLWLPTAAIEHV